MGRTPGSLIELLQAHGVPERAARVYLAACRAGPQTASELARLSALNRVEAYRFIRQLEGSGLLHANGHRPMQFTALSPEELVAQWIRTATERLRSLESGREKILKEVRESVEGPGDDDARKFAVLEGRAPIQRFLIRRIGTATKEVLVSVAGFSLPTAIEGGIDRALKDARARGVKVRFVTEVNGQNLGPAKHFEMFTDLRHAVSPVTNRAIVVDRTGALVWVTGEQGLGPTDEGQVALWSTSPGFVRLAREYHQRMWRGATPATRRFVELESPSDAVLSVPKGQESEAFQRLEEIAALGMRASGVSELRLDLPELIQTVARQLGREIAEEVEGDSPGEVARSLVSFYGSHAMGKLAVVKDKPLVLRVTDCFACTAQSPEIGRVLCPGIIKSVMERRLGSTFEVSAPDPQRHGRHGCLFSIVTG
ncbi:MAG: hypothetical protein L3K09_01205 [Thermoplasmata archaeon]|nr:hypothetical protein [Thermoplasmata archaeon]